MTLVLGPMAVLAASKKGSGKGSGKKAPAAASTSTDRTVPKPSADSTFVPPPAFPTPGGAGLDKAGRPYVGDPFVFRWPLDRVVITSRFGKRRKGRHKGRYHRGTDFDGNPGGAGGSDGPGPGRARRLVLRLRQPGGGGSPRQLPEPLRAPRRGARLPGPDGPLRRLSGAGGLYRALHRHAPALRPLLQGHARWIPEKLIGTHQRRPTSMSARASPILRVRQGLEPSG